MANFSKKQGGKEVGQASVYAKPHTMSGKLIDTNDAGKPQAAPNKKNWVPLEGVSIGNNDTVKTTGIKMRGTGAATKGVMSRGPMA